MQISARNFIDGLAVFSTKQLLWQAPSNALPAAGLLFATPELAEYYGTVLCRANAQPNDDADANALQSTAFLCAAHFLMLQCQPDSKGWIVAVGETALLRIMNVDRPAYRKILFFGIDGNTSFADEHPKEIVVCSVAEYKVIFDNLISRGEIIELIVISDFPSIDIRQDILFTCRSYLARPGREVSAGKILTSTTSLVDFSAIRDLFSELREEYEFNLHQLIMGVKANFSSYCRNGAMFLFLAQRRAAISHELFVNNYTHKTIKYSGPNELSRRVFIDDDLKFHIDSGANQFCFAYVGFEARGLKGISLWLREYGCASVVDMNSFVGIVISFSTFSGLPKKNIIAKDIPVRPKTMFWDEGEGKRSGEDQIFFGGNFQEMKIDLMQLAPADWNGEVRVEFGFQNPGLFVGYSGRFEKW